MSCGWNKSTCEGDYMLLWAIPLLRIKSPPLLKTENQMQGGSRDPLKIVLGEFVHLLMPM